MSAGFYKKLFLFSACTATISILKMLYNKKHKESIEKPVGQHVEKLNSHNPMCNKCRLNKKFASAVVLRKDAHDDDQRVLIGGIALYNQAMLYNHVEISLCATCLQEYIIDNKIIRNDAGILKIYIPQAGVNPDAHQEIYPDANQGMYPDLHQLPKECKNCDETPNECKNCDEHNKIYAHANIANSYLNTTVCHTHPNGVISLGVNMNEFINTPLCEQCLKKFIEMDMEAESTGGKLVFKRKGKFPEIQTIV